MVMNHDIFAHFADVQSETWLWKRFPTEDCCIFLRASPGVLIRMFSRVASRVQMICSMRGNWWKIDFNFEKNKRNELLTFNLMEEFVCADGPETSSIVWRLNIWRAKWKNEKNGAASVIKPFHQSASSEFLFGWQIKKNSTKFFVSLRHEFSNQILN